ncbi:hypothetical protein EVAR_61133_1 [Eumeta japonica]|uniref:Uncharacterized protein n=1 Tax=Eumeta variegata TaxID=151549 RepID=A0A4C2AF43_EUMVA|nr:hypothetical protein EVAR_61133_1 [Eumeta japonica]
MRSKEAAHPKCGPGRREYVVGDMCRLGRFTKGQLRRRPRGNGFACTGWREPVGRHLQGSGNGKKPRMSLLKLTRSNRSGRVSDLLAETFFPDDRVDTDDPYHTEVRRRTDGSSQPPEASGSAWVDPPLRG